MRIRVGVIAFLVVVNLAGIAGGEDKQTLGVGSFSIPDSPAFEILGISPSSVSRPGSARELAVSLFSSSRDDSSFPKNLAIEFSPYWWSYHPELTWERFNPKDEIIGNNLPQTFAISLATAKTTSTMDNQKESTGLGLGFRASLLKGRPSAKGRKSYDRVVDILQKNADFLIPDDPTVLPTDDQGNRILDLDKFTDEKIQVVLDNFRKANLDRVGWRLEAAGATAFEYPNDQSTEGRMRSAGTWLNAAYRTDEGSFLDRFDFLGVFRYLWNKSDDGSFPTYDLGARIIWISAKEDVPLAVSAEYVNRFVSKGDRKDTRKISFVAEYRMDKTLFLFASVGQSFDPNFKGSEAFISLFGINFGYGKGPVVANKQ